MALARHARRVASSFPVLLAVVVVAGCGEDPQAIVAGTAHIKGIVRALIGESRPVHCLIPPAMCPGHFDMRPSDIEAIARGGLVILHPWQEDMPTVRDLLHAAQAPEGRVFAISVEGNWMVPEQQAAGIERVADILREELPEEADGIREKAAALANAARRLEGTLRGRLEAANVARVKVLCSAMQADFVRWAGFEVVETYGRPEEISPADMRRLVRCAAESGAALVVDNLQSGDTKTSAVLARDAGCAHVVLSNFPGGFAGTNSWESTATRNVDLLLEAVDEWRQDHE